MVLVPHSMCNVISKISQRISAMHEYNCNTSLYFVVVNRQCMHCMFYAASALNWDLPSFLPRCLQFHCCMHVKPYSSALTSYCINNSLLRFEVLGPFKLAFYSFQVSTCISFQKHFELRIKRSKYTLTWAFCQHVYMLFRVHWQAS